MKLEHKPTQNNNLAQEENLASVNLLVWLSSAPFFFFSVQQNINAPVDGSIHLWSQQR